MVLLVAWCAAACSGGAAADGLLRPGDHRIDLAYGGRARGYVVHVPPAAAGERALPVVLNFHGAASSGAGQQRFSRMDAVADRAGFVVVYPDGTGRYRRFLTWNAGTCCGSAVLQQVDDVGFALAVLDDCARRTPIDRERVYATGMSNGAMMAHRLAAQVPGRIAAIAPVAGGLVYPLSGRGPAVPVLHVHSVDDPLALYRGGLGRHTAMEADLAEKVRAAIEAHELRLADGTVLRRTGSLGFAVYPFAARQPRAVGWQEIVSLADHGLYAAKRSGRNRWVGIEASDNGMEPLAALHRFRDDPGAAVAAHEIRVQAYGGAAQGQGLRWS